MNLEQLKQRIDRLYDQADKEEKQRTIYFEQSASIPCPMQNVLVGLRVNGRRALRSSFTRYWETLQANYGLKRRGRRGKQSRVKKTRTQRLAAKYGQVD